MCSRCGNNDEEEQDEEDDDDEGQQAARVSTGAPCGKFWLLEVNKNVKLYFYHGFMENGI